MDKGPVAIFSPQLEEWRDGMDLVNHVTVIIFEFFLEADVRFTVYPLDFASCRNDEGRLGLDLAISERFILLRRL